MLGTVTWPLLLIGGLGLALLLIWVWLRRGRIVPGRWVRAGFWSCEIALGGLSLWFSWRLGSPIYFLIFAAMIFPLLRLWQDTAVQSAASGTPIPRTGRISVLQSASIILRVDHDSGKCTGQMLRGALRDWQLQEMDSHDLHQTRTEILPIDPVGVALLDVWLDRHGPLHWRKDFGGGTELPPAAPAVPTVGHDEAATILGLGLNATAPDIDIAAERLLDLLGRDAPHAFVTDWIAAARAALTT